MKIKCKNKLDIFFWIICILLFTIRLFFCLSSYDEVYNIKISFDTILGQKHLVDNTVFFQTGDLFNMPFVYIFYKITNGLDGIVIFLRLCYLALNLLMGILFAKVFKAIFGERVSFLFMLIIITFAPNSLYNIWYDSVSLYFWLMGTLFLLGIVWEKENKKKQIIYGILSGICLACMVYAYPTMIFVLCFTIIGFFAALCMQNRKQIKINITKLLPVIGGGIIVVSIFLIYVLYQGPQNIYFFKEGTITGGISGRVLGDIVQNPDNDIIDHQADEDAGEIASYEKQNQLWNTIKDRISEMGKRNFNHQRNIVVLLAVFLVQYVIAFKWVKGLRKILFLEFIFINIINGYNDGAYAHYTMFALSFLMAPLWLVYLPIEERKTGKILMLTMWLPSIIGWLVVGFTALYPGKSCQGLYLGGIAGFVLLLLNVRATFKKENVVASFTLFLAFSNVFVYYNNAFENKSVKESKYLIRNGIYKGIYVQEEDVKYEQIELKSKEYLQEKRIQTATYLQNYMSIFLWSQAKAGNSTEKVYELLLDQNKNLGEVIPQIPDMLIINEELGKAEGIEGFKEIYCLIYVDDSVEVYIKNHEYLEN